jgi:uncharacterized membrane protein
MDLFLAAETSPFLVSALVMIAIAVLEGVGLVAGVSATHWLDHMLPQAHGGEGMTDSWLGWLHVGRVPMLVIIVVLLASFSIVGFAGNLLVHALTGHYVPRILSVPAAFFASVPVVRISGSLLQNVLPRDETFAVSIDSLVGRIATIVNGNASMGRPAEARVTNEHGQTLYVMVEPDLEDASFGPNHSVLLVRRVGGKRFRAIDNPRPDLL